MERMRERENNREYQKILCKVLLGNFQIQFFFSQETNRERETCNRNKRAEAKALTINDRSSSEIGSPTIVPQPIIERDRN